MLAMHQIKEDLIVPTYSTIYPFLNIAFLDALNSTVSNESIDFALISQIAFLVYSQLRPSGPVARSSFKG